MSLAPARQEEAHPQVSTLGCASVRLATRQDVKMVASLIRQLADYEDYAHLCTFQDEGLEESLFKLPAYQGPTVLLLEVSQLSRGASATDDLLVYEEVDLGDCEDPEEELFRSKLHPDRVVAGYSLFFPKFSSFQANVGFYMEDLYIRKPFRGKGLGTLLLRALASECAKRGAGRVEWVVLDWNHSAINFYDGIGARVMPEWRIYRLTGDKLAASATF